MLRCQHPEQRGIAARALVALFLAELGGSLEGQVVSRGSLSCLNRAS